MVAAFSLLKKFFKDLPDQSSETSFISYNLGIIAYEIKFIDETNIIDLLLNVARIIKENRLIYC